MELELTEGEVVALANALRSVHETGVEMMLVINGKRFRLEGRGSVFGVNLTIEDIEVK